MFNDICLICYAAANENVKAMRKAKYSAPPRRLTGLIFVGAATRMPGVREFIEKVGCMGRFFLYAGQGHHASIPWTSPSVPRNSDM
jgi:hypothetical protein